MSKQFWHQISGRIFEVFSIHLESKYIVLNKILVRDKERPADVYIATFLLQKKIARLKTCFSVNVLARTARKIYFGQRESYQCKFGPNSVFKIMIYG